MIALLKAVTKASTDRDTWVQQGFPKSVVDAFLATAQLTNSVVMTRVPGKATTQLIQEEYDLKGFFIKAKSCNWGPMSGFLCRNPAFNKNGSDGIDFNRKETYKYKKKLVEKFKMPNTVAEFQNRAFLPLRISDTRKKQFLNEFREAPVFNFGPPLRVDASNPKSILGLAASGDQKANQPAGSVIMEFLLNQITEGGQIYWQVYYGNVYVRQANGSYQKYESGSGYATPAPAEDADIRKALQQEPDPNVVFSSGQIGTLRSWLQALNIARDDSDKCYTVDGIMNPYPPNPGKPRDPKNAVTGDYDLFAVWPALPPAGFDNLQRISELKPDEATRHSEYPQFGDAAISRRILLPVAGKEFSLEFTRSRNVYLEFIPPFGVIDQLENEFYGNVNEAVLLAAGTLNSLLANKGYLPNKAFHSDEGGRPGMDEVEYPVAVFLPSALAAAVEAGPALVISRHAELLALIELLQGRCYIPLNHGWMIHWMALLQDDNVLNAQGNQKKGYFVRRKEERSQLNQNKLPGTPPETELAFVRRRLEDLSTRSYRFQVQGNEQIVWTEIEKYLRETLVAVNDFIALKDVFWQMAVNENADQTPEDWKARVAAIGQSS